MCALCFSVIASVPLALAGVLALALALLALQISLIPGMGSYNVSEFWIVGLTAIGAAAFAIASLWAAGWTLRKGVELATGALSAARAEPPAST